MMKRCLKLLFFMILLCTSICAMELGYAKTQDYVIASDGTIIMYLGNESSIIIPDQINGQEISGIHDEAFSVNGQTLLPSDPYILDLELPVTIKRIGQEAFYGQADLATVTLNEGLVKIEHGAFKDCRKLKSIVIPSTVDDMGGTIFAGTGIETIYFSGDCPSYIGNHTFSNFSYGEYTDFENLTIYYPAEYANSYSQVMEWYPNINWLAENNSSVDDNEGMQSETVPEYIQFSILDEEYLKVFIRVYGSNVTQNDDVICLQTGDRVEFFVDKSAMAQSNGNGSFDYHHMQIIGGGDQNAACQYIDREVVNAFVEEEYNGNCAFGCVKKEDSQYLVPDGNMHIENGIILVYPYVAVLPGEYSYYMQAQCVSAIVNGEMSFDESCEAEFTLKITEGQQGDTSNTIGAEVGIIDAIPASVGIMETSCIHTNATAYYDEGALKPKFSSITETHHDVQNGYKIICDDCGEFTGETGYFDAVSEQHIYSNGDVCVCGYDRNKCAHTGEWIKGDTAIVGTGKFLKISDTQHKRISVDYEYICANCGFIEVRTDPEDGTPDSHLMKWYNTTHYEVSADNSQHRKVGQEVCCWSAAGKMHYCYDSNGNKHIKNAIGKWEDHSYDNAGKCTMCEYIIEPIEPMYTLDDINAELDELYRHANIAYSTAIANQYESSYDEITALLFSKGTGAFTFQLKRLTDEDVEKIVEMMILMELDDIEYISNTVFSDFESWCSEQGFGYKDFESIDSLIRTYGIDSDINDGRWLDELGERIATSEKNEDIDTELELFESIKTLYYYYQATYSGISAAKSFIGFVSDLQENGKNYEMRVYMQGATKERLTALKTGFTDQRIIDAIDDYQWEIDNALGQWALDSMYTTLTDGRKTYGSYCKFIDHLKNVRVLKHVPNNVTKYLNAEKKFKEYKIGGKFMVEDIIAGAKSFDIIATISNLIFDADGLTDIIALLEREAMLLASEYENKPVAKVGDSKDALITRVYALAALTDATYMSINDLVQLEWKFFTTGTTGMFHMLFGDDTTLADIHSCENQVYLLRNELSDTVNSLQEMIQNCPELKNGGGKTDGSGSSR